MYGERRYDDGEIESSMKSEGSLRTIASALDKSSAGTFGDSSSNQNAMIMILAVDIGKAFLMVSMSEVAIEMFSELFHDTTL